MKYSFYFLLSVFLIGCSNNSDDATPETQEFTITINVDPSHYGGFFMSAKAFISDENGEIITDGELLPGQSTTLNAITDPSQSYDLSIMLYRYLDFVDEKFYGITTFTDIEPGTFELGAGPISEDSADEIYINLTNAGYPCEITSGTTGHAPFGPENGGFVNYRGNLVGSPSSDFYISFKSPNDQFGRYFWEEDIMEGTIFNIDYPSLPEIQSIIDIQLPSNNHATFKLQGLVNNDPDNIHHSIAQGNYIDGMNALSVPVPVGVFDYYLFATTFGTDDSGYSKILFTANIPDEITTPSLGFTVIDQSLGNFNMETEGEAILYSAIFRTSTTNPAISIAHSVYGPVSPTVSFSKENLWLNIRAYYPDLSSFSTLPLGNVSIRNHSEISSYHDISKKIIERKTIEPTQPEEYMESYSQEFD